MMLRDKGKIIELRIHAPVLPNSYMRMGARPGVFPDKIIVKQPPTEGSEEVSITEYFPHPPIHPTAEPVDEMTLAYCNKYLEHEAYCAVGFSEECTCNRSKVIARLTQAGET